MKSTLKAGGARVRSMVQVTGIEKIQSQLKRYTKSAEKGMEAGLKICGLTLQRASQNRVPVLYGDLRRSAFTRHEGNGFNTEVTVGYTQSYAVFVHEGIKNRKGGKRGRLTGPREPKGKTKRKLRSLKGSGNRGPKFLEAPARELAPQFPKIVRQQIRKMLSRNTSQKAL